MLTVEITRGLHALYLLKKVFPVVLNPCLVASTMCLILHPRHPAAEVLKRLQKPSIEFPRRSMPPEQVPELKLKLSTSKDPKGVPKHGDPCTWAAYRGLYGPAIT